MLACMYVCINLNVCECKYVRVRICNCYICTYVCIGSHMCQLWYAVQYVKRLGWMVYGSMWGMMRFPTCRMTASCSSKKLCNPASVRKFTIHSFTASSILTSSLHTYIHTYSTYIHNRMTALHKGG